MNPSLSGRFVSVLFLLGAAVTAQAAVSCSVSTSGVAFGSYSTIFNQDRDTSGTISVTCSGSIGDPVNYALRLSSGSGTFLDRAISNSNDSLQYNLYTDVARSQVWGDGSSGTLVVSDGYSLATSPTSKQYIVFGRIPAGQTHGTIGAYSDTITITLDY